MRRHDPELVDLLARGPPEEFHERRQLCQRPARLKGVRLDKRSSQSSDREEEIDLPETAQGGSQPGIIGEDAGEILGPEDDRMDGGGPQIDGPHGAAGRPEGDLAPAQGRRQPGGVSGRKIGPPRGADDRFHGCRRS